MNIKELISEKYSQYDGMIANAISMLEDIKLVKNDISKDVLLNTAINKFNDAVALRKEIAEVTRKYLIPSPDAMNIFTKHTLKEAGLTDMDDPAYGRIVPYRELIGEPSPIDSPNNDHHLDAFCKLSSEKKDDQTSISLSNDGCITKNDLDCFGLTKDDLKEEAKKKLHFMPLTKEDAKVIAPNAIDENIYKKLPSEKKTKSRKTKNKVDLSKK